MSDQLPERMVRMFNDTIEQAIEVGRLRLQLQTRAEDEVRQEHPHWFIEYPDPRGAREKILHRRRMPKIESRWKKRHYAVEKRFQQLSEGIDFGELLVGGIRQAMVTKGYASAQTEVDYLQDLYDRSGQPEQGE